MGIKRPRFVFAEYHAAVDTDVIQAGFRVAGDRAKKRVDIAAAIEGMP